MEQEIIGSEIEWCFIRANYTSCMFDEDSDLKSYEKKTINGTNVKKEIKTKILANSELKRKHYKKEIQKPVSAYALFFRDKQFQIKSDYPDYSFGEVSKMVAKLWDALNFNEKLTYKMKTEAAKKAYLKELARYKARIICNIDENCENQ